MSLFSQHSMYIPLLGIVDFCPFRLAGDLCLALSGPWLLYKLSSQGTLGISTETQILRLIMFTSRYLDVFSLAQFSSYNTFMKWVILSSSFSIVATLIAAKIRAGFQSTDVVSNALIIGIWCIFALISALCWNYKFTFMEVAWAFSQYLSCISDLDQFQVNIKSGAVDWRTLVYLLLITGARLFYIPHWVFRYKATHALDPIACLCGIMALYGHIFCFAVLAFSVYRKKQRDHQCQELVADEKRTVSEKAESEPILVDI